MNLNLSDWYIISYDSRSDLIFHIHVSVICSTNHWYNMPIFIVSPNSTHPEPKASGCEHYRINHCHFLSFILCPFIHSFLRICLSFISHLPYISVSFSIQSLQLFIQSSLGAQTPHHYEPKASNVLTNSSQLFSLSALTVILQPVNP